MSLHPSHLLLDRTYAAVLFDLDGTLIASIGSVERSWTRLAQEYEIPADRFGDFHGVPARRHWKTRGSSRRPNEPFRVLDRIRRLRTVA